MNHYNTTPPTSDEMNHYTTTPPPAMKWTTIPRHLHQRWNEPLYNAPPPAMKWTTIPRHLHQRWNEPLYHDTSTSDEMNHYTKTPPLAMKWTTLQRHLHQRWNEPLYQDTSTSDETNHYTTTPPPAMKWATIPRHLHQRALYHDTSTSDEVSYYTTTPSSTSDEMNHFGMPLYLIVHTATQYKGEGRAGVGFVFLYVIVYCYFLHQEAIYPNGASRNCHSTFANLLFLPSVSLSP